MALLLERKEAELNFALHETYYPVVPHHDQPFQIGQYAECPWPFRCIVLVSAIIAVPLAWYVVRQWLGGFAYRVDIHWWVFTVVVLLVLLLTAAIVTTLTWNTATMNPVRSIKTE